MFFIVLLTVSMEYNMSASRALGALQAVDIIFLSAGRAGEAAPLAAPAAVTGAPPAAAWTAAAETRRSCPSDSISTGYSSLEATVNVLHIYT